MRERIDIPIDFIPCDVEPIDTPNRYNLQITIGSYLFTLISYDLNDLDNRGSVKITSKSIIPDYDIEKTFFVYSSKSELGFWRLCAIEDFSRQLYKGEYDYVQQTFIHLDLQNFININIDIIPKESNHKSCTYIDKKLKTEIIEHANNTERILELDFNVKEFNDIYYNECFYKPGLKQCSDEPDLKTLSYISDYLKNNYEIISSNFKFNFNKNIEIQKDINLIVRGKIYECILRKNSSTTTYNNDIYLYYLSYSINIGDINEKNQFIPIFATDTNYNKITRFGLYYNYIMMYQYICKCLQYTIICERRGDRSYPRCSTDYSYIGSIYQNLFPFTIFKERTIKDIKRFKSIDEQTKEDVRNIKKLGLIPSQLIISNKSQKKQNVNWKSKYIKYKNKYMQLKNNM